MLDQVRDAHGDVIKRLASRLTVAAAELRRAAERGHPGDREDTLRVATRLEQIGYRILADNRNSATA